MSPQSAKETTGAATAEGQITAREVHDALAAVEQRFAQVPLVNSERVPSKDDLAEVKDLLDDAAKKLKKLEATS